MRYLKAGRIIRISFRLIKLTLFLDKEGLLCIEGRLENTESEVNKHIHVLPNMHLLTKALVWKAHHDDHHSEVDRMLVEFSKKFGIARG